MRTFNELQLGEAQGYRNLVVIPILGNSNTGLEYITLAAALKEETLLVSEASESGSVTEIHVINKKDMPVLILDGEELRGAKQNRASNTTVLVPANSEIKLNVSCTESDRWHYISKRFSDSEVVMAHGIRRAKSFSVSEGFRSYHQAYSDQVEVWEEIERLHETTRSSSPTRAMRDVFEAHRSTLDECLAAFPLVEGQRGFIFIANGTVLGMDLLSRPQAYQEVHQRLLGSYAMEAMKVLSNSDEINEVYVENIAREFIEQVLAGMAEVYPSAGLGDDVRIQSVSACGSALLHERVCIHAALFSLDTSRQTSEEGPRMNAFRRWLRRRRYL